MIVKFQKFYEEFQLNIILHKKTYNTYKFI